MNKKRIGILLGTFDPIHIGHMSIITEAFNTYGMDEVVIVPAWHNPWKGDANVSYKERLAMCKMVADELGKFYQGVHGNSLVRVSDIERMLATKSRDTVYSSDVLKKMMDFYSGTNVGLYILCGSDVASDIKDWHEGEWILANVGIIEVGRIGATEDIPEHGIKVSSTVIREMLMDGICPLPYVTSGVYNYIKKQGLYKKEEDEKM